MLSFAQEFGWDQLLNVITKLPANDLWPVLRLHFYVLPPLGLVLANGFSHCCVASGSLLY